MSSFTATKCDICGKVKGEGNHWFFGLEVSDTSTIAFSNNPMQHTIAEDLKILNYDLCSEACALKLFNKVIGARGQKNESPATLLSGIVAGRETIKV